MPRYDYDLFVIGGGSGGVRAARVTAGLGKRVAIAEEYRFGGTCVIRGCVPKKLLVYASQFSEAFEDAAGYGWTVGETAFDWATLIANKDREIARLENIYRSGVEKAGGTTFRSRAELVDRHTVRLLAENRTVTAETILIATGGRPAAHIRTARSRTHHHIQRRLPSAASCRRRSSSPAVAISRWSSRNFSRARRRRRL